GTASVLLRPTGRPADHLGDKILEPRGRYPVMRFIDSWVRVQTRVNHDAIDEVLDNRGDTVDAAQPIIQTGLILIRPGMRSSTVLALCHAVARYAIRTGSPRRIVPPCTTAAYTPTLTWLCWAAVRRMPGSLGSSPCASVVITHRPHGPVMCRRTAVPM